MSITRLSCLAAIGAVAIGTALPAHAQLGQFPGLSGSTSGSSTGGLAGAASNLLGGGGLPGLGSAIGSTGSSNAAGILSYCVQNQLLGGAQQAAATSTVSSLSQQQGVTGSNAYTQGQSGTLVTGQGQSFSLDSLKGQVKSKVCSLMLNHAKSLL
ncbi:hypothetical protein FHR90_000804 [Endobacter medicaginis]|jgi:Protein of unknown function (DUF2501)|uniref:DUF2501 domain-containing protein n=1 Tax=Endobacter medicaginis TaxID=1181271 RepID=A0A839UT76_9PROT|nr:DUF2501 domain-containing protein [Endobacter medicaginis]MBB3172986.1 hypothetical protein [Endobacter medicaginis]MCX5475234.1 DUF2501 domain-containing protein [Endobacter medicaginis]NVN30938.1 DUF2501 domain-containing protein [Endobacter medicaginis]